MERNKVLFFNFFYELVLIFYDQVYNANNNAIRSVFFMSYDSYPMWLAIRR